LEAELKTVLIRKLMKRPNLHPYLRRFKNKGGITIGSAGMKWIPPTPHASLFNVVNCLSDTVSQDAKDGLEILLRMKNLHRALAKNKAFRKFSNAALLKDVPL
jgi:hypothetical protein